ncbi:hypothetical protein QBC33DRAFT_550919 [Phialemonium atrogriseum]|uniref:Uncharacterized protein n=1 Tax=Phialemonium atrogriseum TaxID=1093897 RepID=A0AAJ0FBV0_9PEZI|nr:uncharacterized protein QBC33DRAFT_550919 [Phialemonium atrogriseum]KAK1762896.1 hypothetical protein QBC33DRAFT_550919 [Phialemonium atrogriseum]
MQAQQFWVNEAHKQPDARALANDQGLELPAGNFQGLKAGLKYPIRRLVMTGKDTPENFRIFFGVDSVPDIHAETRKEVLMTPTVQEGSPSQMMNRFWDEGCPSFSPRPATEAEQAEIQRQLDFIQGFSGFLGSR